MKVAVLNGVNLNMLGVRDPEHYGTLTLPELDARVRDAANGLRRRGDLTDQQRERIRRADPRARGTSTG